MRVFRKLGALLAVLALVAVGCGSDETSTDKQAESSIGCDYLPTDSPAAREVKLPGTDLPEELPEAVVLTTNVGDLTITLDAEAAPCTVNSFVSLAKQDYFSDTSCHRLTTSGIFVLQCGDPTGTGAGGPGYRFADELHNDDDRLQPCQPSGGGTVCTYAGATVAMANAGPDTNGSQFFLVYDDSPLAPNYTVFGHLDAAGFQVVQQVADEGVRGGSADGPPAQGVTITGTTLLK